jgi:hypothetical protein
LGQERRDGWGEVLKNVKAILIAAVLTGALCQGAGAAPPGRSVAFPDGSIFKDVRLTWEGKQLIFYATFNQDGHDLPLWLEWRTAKTDGHAQIDIIEQYGRDMPIAVTLMDREKNPAGGAIFYMGRPAPNTPRLETSGNLNVSLAMTDMAGHSDDYKFSLAPAGPETLPRISVVK